MDYIFHNSNIWYLLITWLKAPYFLWLSLSLNLKQIYTLKIKVCDETISNKGNLANLAEISCTHAIVGLVLQTLTYNDILWVVRTHPAVGWERCQGRIETVHVVQKRTKITLDECSYTTAPKNSKGENCTAGFLRKPSYPTKFLSWTNKLWFFWLSNDLYRA